MGSTRTRDRQDSGAGLKPRADPTSDRCVLKRQACELHSVLGEDGKVQVEVVWKSTDPARGRQRAATGVYAFNQLTGEDRQAFIDRVDAFMCELNASH